MAGRFPIVRKIGAGGWATVYEAWDLPLDRRVALKILHQPSEQTKRRFFQEARVAAAISHPNVAAIYDVSETEEGDPFLVMELLEGETLGDAMARSPFAVGRVVEIARQILAALEALAERGIVHRDLKPENLFLHGSRGTLKLVDFGISIITSSSDILDETSLVDGSAIMGTPPYMAPEQIDGRPPDQRTDLYALGVILYEMASGRCPHEAASQSELFAAILRDPIPKLRNEVPECPDELASVVDRALELEPDRRFRTAAEMDSALAAIALGPRSSCILRASVSLGDAPTRRIATLPRAEREMKMVRELAGPVGVVLAAVLFLASVSRHPRSQLVPRPARSDAVLENAGPVFISPADKTITRGRSFS